MKVRRQSTSRPGVWIVLLVVVIGALTAGSLFAYLSEREQGQLDTVASPVEAESGAALRDHVEVTATVHKVDAPTLQLHLTVELEPHGIYADSQGNLTEPLVLITNTVPAAPLQFPAGKSLEAVEFRLPVDSGTFTDYPFDRYPAELQVAAESATGETVPVTLAIGNRDSFFTLSDATQSSDDNATALSFSEKRSTGTTLFAVFVMVLLWLLMVAVILAVWHLVSQRKGLVWPSLSFLGVVLFALVPLRNALPGQPPLGSLIDFTSFFVAEIVVALALITCVVAGFVTDRKPS
ncbi:DUF4436 family protein [Rhodococcus qingshengii]|uniref:DUF4436 family protein n=1 Tax=Rhodococcus qingshengii TaxID=334542 RepID=UPI00237CDB65|nr:DUF4436 family protein [Rhodococcus qingshengii]WCT06008.1 DUF4436 family protein [Rhodococcus qingshengii]